MRAVILLPILAAACMTDHNLGNSPPVLGQTRWAITLGGPGQETADLVATDPSGNVIAAGILGEAVDFGSGAAPVSSSATAAWIGKRSAADGSQMWTRELGTDQYGFVQLEALTTDASGHIFVAGGVRSDTDFGGASLVNHGSDGFVVEYDGDGHALWAAGVTPRSNAILRSIAVAQDGRVYATGSCTSGILDFPPNIAWCGGTFMVAYDSSGTLLWGRQYAGIDSIDLVATTDDTVLGIFSSNAPVTLDGIVVNPNATESLMLAVINPRGGIGAAGVLGDDAIPRHLVSVTGTPDGFVTSEDAADPAGEHPEIAAWDESGGHRWSSNPTAGSPSISAMTTTAQADVISIGFAQEGGFDYGKGTIAGPMFLMAQSDTGEFVEGKSYGGHLGGSIRAFGVAASGSGTVAFVGIANGQVDVGTGPLPTAGGSDILIGLIDPPQ